MKFSKRYSNSQEIKHSSSVARLITAGLLVLARTRKFIIIVEVASQEAAVGEAEVD